MLYSIIMPRRSPALLVPLLAASSPVTLEQLQRALGHASRATTFRYLRQVRHIRSYNHNGRFYTDPACQRFDRFGLFSLGGVHFSRDGSLSATVLRLLGESDDGYTDRELRDLLHVAAYPFLRAAVRQQRARRERLGGVYVYFSADPPTAEQQRRARQTRLHARLADTLEPAVIIAVLLALIRHPGSPPGQLVCRLQGHSPPVPLVQVQAVFERFELHRIGEKGGLPPADAAERVLELVRTLPAQDKS